LALLLLALLDDFLFDVFVSAGMLFNNLGDTHDASRYQVQTIA
jgi:hypothetical protein